jgi:excisionase family DNA binding protein
MPALSAAADLVGRLQSAQDLSPYIGKRRKVSRMLWRARRCSSVSEHGLSALMSKLPSVPPQLHTLEDAAQRLACCARTLRREIDRGRVHVVRIGRAVRISEQEVRRLVSEGTHIA